MSNLYMIKHYIMSDGDKMKILLVDLWRVIKYKGGAEKVFFDMANTMSRRGHNVTALGLQDAEGKPSFYVDSKVRFVNAGIGLKVKKNFFQKVKSLFLSNDAKVKYSEAIYDKLKGNRLAPVINSGDFDIIISFSVEATRILINTLHVKKPIITMFHFAPQVILNGISENTIEALNKCACIQVLLPSYVDVVKKYVDVKVVCIPNIVPQYQFNEVVPDNTIINIARIDRQQKRQLLLIDAFNKIKVKYPDWQVEFWGNTDFDKKYYNECLKAVKDNQLTERVHFCGTTDNVLEKYQKAKIFVFPSLHEGFGLALTEAMSAGLPAIGYKNCVGTNELIINGKTGILCDDGVDSLALALDELMSDAELRKKMGKAAKEEMKQYAPDKIWDMWEELMNKFVS